MIQAVIFATGSPITVDIEESLHRAGIDLRGGIQNRTGDCWLTDERSRIGVEDLDQTITALPYIVPLFSPKNRAIAVAEARALGFAAPFTLIDPTAVIPRDVRFGDGSYAGAGTSFGGASRFGAFTFINRGASVGHHFAGGDYVSIGPGAVIAGQVTVGESSLIGAGAVVLPARRIGAGAVIGGGAVVMRDVPPGATVVGNPARVVGLREATDMGDLSDGG